MEVQRLYTVKDFDLLTGELNWSTGEFDYSRDSPKIITLNLFAPERRTILPYEIKEQVEVLVHDLVQRYQVKTESVSSGKNEQDILYKRNTESVQVQYCHNSLLERY